ncbi:hypothetical protein [Paenilisteria rocourtiae]|uniref:Uncharacterized protein n=1 Tax=Listeria rocourtiae TaxID=647910 RepID=A0A4R6ZNX0_9LIST|nr:hypothetical protein [Listeria rocourtiae]EUJ51815.1 hypothetical protein PROCOU_01552 [Listeria rocourtiae FSL F6-920]TDR54207.1 hypothetical protein DFP96_103308 [Listeria rocourtiae]
MKIDYKEFANFIKGKGIVIVESECYDHSSGWKGKNMYVRDDNGFLNEDGNYYDSAKWGTIDLSGNGYCFNAGFIAGNYEKIKKFYAMNSLSTFEDFSTFIQSVTVEKGAE